MNRQLTILFAAFEAAQRLAKRSDLELRRIEAVKPGGGKQIDQGPGRSIIPLRGPIGTLGR